MYPAMQVHHSSLKTRPWKVTIQLKLHQTPREPRQQPGKLIEGVAWTCEYDQLSYLTRRFPVPTSRRRCPGVVPVS